MLNEEGVAFVKPFGELPESETETTQLHSELGSKVCYYVSPPSLDTTIPKHAATDPPTAIDLARYIWTA